MRGKIAKFDTTTGGGTIILEDRTFIDFNIKDWSSYETLPSIGILVEVDGDKISPSDVDADELIARRDAYINSTIANGWRMESSNEQGFVLSYKRFEIVVFLFYLLVFSLVLGILFGFISLIPSSIISYFIAKSSHTISGTLDYENNALHIYKNGKEYKTI